VILVVDASVKVKWFFRDPAIEEHAEHALFVLQSMRAGTVEILQPPHWLAAVIARPEPVLADEAMDVLDAMELPVAADVAVYKRATSLSAALRQHDFDTLCHAVALEHGAELISADRRYYRVSEAPRTNHLSCKLGPVAARRCPIALC
jgi:predicted nucleic acid-binding protein